MPFLMNTWLIPFLMHTWLIPFFMTWLIQFLMHTLLILFFMPWLIPFLMNTWLIPFLVNTWLILFLVKPLAYFFECLSRQSSLVINIVGTDDISQLLRSVRVWQRAHLNECMASCKLFEVENKESGGFQDVTWARWRLGKACTVIHTAWFPRGSNQMHPLQHSRELRDKMTSWNQKIDRGQKNLAFRSSAIQGAGWRHIPAGWSWSWLTWWCTHRLCQAQGENNFV